MIRTVLEIIGEGYLEAKQQPFAQHGLAQFIRGDAADTMAAIVDNDDLLYVGSAGQSKWADVPWLSVLNPEITQNTWRGYYAVYLFAADMTEVSLVLGQAVTQCRHEFGRGFADELARRAALFRARVPEHADRFPDLAFELRGTTQLARDYEAAPAFGITYSLASLPDDEALDADLREMVRLYMLLVARGGVENLETADEGETGDADITIEERKKYARHRRIDRSTKAGKVKEILGTICQACGFDFEAIYGEVGKGYIEAHHLVPLASYEEGETVSLDPRTDFAVLCANCHRMMHRKEGPTTLEELRQILAAETG